jgi:putative endonuclease
LSLKYNNASSSSYWLYILQCNDGTFYTGICKNTAKRLSQHNAGTGAKYTKHRTPVILVYSEECASRSTALKREYAIKQLSRTQKSNLIKENASQKQ